MPLVLCHIISQIHTLNDLKCEKNCVRNIASPVAICQWQTLQFRLWTRILIWFPFWRDRNMASQWEMATTKRKELKENGIIDGRHEPNYKQCKANIDINSLDFRFYCIDLCWASTFDTCLNSAGDFGTVFTLAHAHYLHCPNNKSF